jgi:hypothetical protein
MKAALLSLALLGGQSAILVSDRVPHLRIEALCKATAADDKENGIVLGQSFENCMRDETAALQQLTAVWSSNAGTVRDRCETEAMIGDDSQSYVDLLTCMQAAGLANTASPAISLRGASKNRNAK